MRLQHSLPAAYPQGRGRLGLLWCSGECITGKLRKDPCEVLEEVGGLPEDPPVLSSGEQEAPGFS